MTNKVSMSVIHLDFDFQAITSQGQTINLKHFVQFLRITKTVATWFTQVELGLSVPVDIFYQLIPISDLKYSLNVYFKHNNRIIETYTYRLQTYVSNITNMISKEEPSLLNLILVPTYVNELIQGVDFYKEGQVTLTQVVQTLLANTTVNYISKVDNEKQLYDVFVPYMPKINALSYVLREFGYTDDLYTIYCDLNGLNIVTWNDLKNKFKDFIIEVLPTGYQFHYAFVRQLSYLERTDIKLRIQQDPRLVQQQSIPVNNEPFAWINKGNNSPNPPKTQLDKVYYKTLQDRNLIYGNLIPRNSLFPLDLLYPLKVTSKDHTFANLLGTYMITDLSVSCDFTKSNNTPDLTFHAIKRED